MSGKEASSWNLERLARQQIGEWDPDATTLYYCELCRNVFPSFSMFYDHREASEHTEARIESEDQGFRAYAELEAGEAVPDGATVAPVAPCEPMEGR